MPVWECAWCMSDQRRTSTITVEGPDTPDGWALQPVRPWYRACPEHSVNCETCETTITPADVLVSDSTSSGCSACLVAVTCIAGCGGSTWVLRSMADHLDELLPVDRACRYCRQDWTCSECNIFNRDTVRYVERRGRNMCEDCRTGNTPRDNDNEEQRDVRFEGPLMCLEALRNRPIRAMSLELEFRGATDRLARELRNKELTIYGEMLGYHARVPETDLIHVESDSSVDGELVISRINMTDAEQVKALTETLDVVNDLQDEEALWVDQRCGAHVHIDLHGFNPLMCETLAHVFGYLEDPIYRLASARWACHRTLSNGNNYATPIPKGPFASRMDFVNNFMLGAGHGSAINMEHFNQNMRASCRCGAVSWDAGWETCICRIPKCTVEFRVFNGTSNPKKIMAYAAICQSIVAVSKDFPQGFRDLEAMDYAGLYAPDGQETRAEVLHKSWMERLEWMFKNLPFSNYDKENILYCVEHSDLNKIGPEFMEYLHHVQYDQPDIPPQTPELRGFPGSEGAEPAINDPISAARLVWDEVRTSNTPRPSNFAQATTDRLSAYFAQDELVLEDPDYEDEF